jgi:hypothetical protein
VNGLLVLLKNIGAVLKNIHVLIGVMKHGEDTLKHLQDARVSTRGGRGITTAGRVRRDYIRRRRDVVVDGKLGKSRAKKLMCNILVEPLMSHCLNHANDEGSESTQSERIDGDVSNLIHYVVKDIKVEGPEKVTRGGVNESQLKFLEGTRPMSHTRPDVPLF